MGLNPGKARAPLRAHPDNLGGRCATIVLLFATMLALLAGAGLAQTPADAGLQVQPWDARVPVRAFTLTGTEFRGGLVLRVTGTASKITGVGSAGLISADGAFAPLAATLSGDGTIRPDLPVTVRLSATLPEGQTWRGDIWLTSVDAQGMALLPLSVRPNPFLKGL